MITFEQAQAIHTRLMWDDILNPYNHVRVPLKGIRGSIEEAVRLSLKTGPVTLIIMPWGVYSHLSKQDTAEHGYDFDKWSIRVNSGTDGTLWGYVGTFLGVDVLANLHANQVWVTRAPEPRQIDGSNTLFVEVSE
jgi:hypothetical protein